MNAFLTTALHLLWTFSQLSVLGFGGGKGIIPQMHRDAVSSYHWVSSAQFTQFYTIGKLVPGPTTVFAALIGYSAMPGRPWLGALLATIGMFVPSSTIMVIADAYWARFEGSAWRTIVSRGLAPAIVGLVWSSVWTIARGAPAGPLAYAVTAIVAILMLRTTLSAPILIALSGVVGIIALR
ncbi:MAG: chromate transporter [Candidatus Eremiobacteraeota bacterium]|nr:chromate transporter [Candidatus Eremiobacteraeota bacterium]